MRALVIAVCALALSACGVSSQGEPQLIEESTQPPPPAPPSFDTETSPPPSTTGSSPGPTTLTPVPQSGMPGLGTVSGGAG